MKITFLLLLQLMTKGRHSVVSFNFSNFDQNSLEEIYFQGDAFSSDGALQLTRNQFPYHPVLDRSVGRASYAKSVLLWDNNTRRLTDFTTHFSFIMNSTKPRSADGISFFIAPFESQIPPHSNLGLLALFSSEKALDTSANRIVAVEFDIHKNPWDPNSNHVGIDVNSIMSVTWNYTSMEDGRLANAWVNYNSTSQSLNVFLTYADNPIFTGNNYILSHNI